MPLRHVNFPFYLQVTRPPGYQTRRRTREAPGAQSHVHVPFCLQVENDGGSCFEPLFQIQWIICLSPVGYSRKSSTFFKRLTIISKLPWPLWRIPLSLCGPFPLLQMTRLKLIEISESKAGNEQNLGITIILQSWASHPGLGHAPPVQGYVPARLGLQNSNEHRAGWHPPCLGSHSSKEPRVTDKQVTQRWIYSNWPAMFPVILKTINN